MLHAAQNLVDGEPVSDYRQITDPAEARAHETVIKGDLHDRVWDAASGTLRKRNPVEDLEVLRDEKMTDLAEKGRDEVGLLLTPGFERDELVMRLCATVVQLAQATGFPATLDPDIVAVAQNGKAVQGAHDRLKALDLTLDVDVERKIREERLI